MSRKMCSYYKHSKDMIRIVDVGFLWPQHFNKIVRETTCDGCIACVTFFLHETSLFLVSLFYSKCYVTMFVRELSRSPIAIGENFFLKWEEIVSNHFFSSKTSVFVFFFLRFWIDFFLSVSFRYILYFFLVRQWLDGFCWFCDLLFFHSYEKT